MSVEYYNSIEKLIEDFQYKIENDEKLLNQ
jgi:hypothetical protein